MKIQDVLEASNEKLVAELTAAGWDLQGSETLWDNQHNMAAELCQHGEHTYFAAYSQVASVVAVKIRADATDEAAEKLARIDRDYHVMIGTNEAAVLDERIEDASPEDFLRIMAMDGWVPCEVVPTADEWILLEKLE